MNYFIFAIISSIVLCFMFFHLAKKDCEWYNHLSALLGVICGVIAICLIPVLCTMGWEWRASEYKVKVINGQYNTNYTKEEVFYASDVIEEIRKLERKRIEVNGDLFKKVNDIE